MLNVKGFGKAVACLLAVCLLLASPVSALSGSLVSTTTGSVNMAPEVSLENMNTDSQGHLVSVVHRSASGSSTVIGCLENGTKLTVLEEKKHYYKIDCYDMKGYIAKSQVAVDECGEYYVNSNGAESKYLDSYSAQEVMELKADLIKEAKKHLGTPYKWGGTTPKGFDCSGFTSYVFGKVGIEINRTVINQLSNGVIVAKEDLQPGDLVIFSNTGSSGFASHVGIYIGNGQIIHSGSSKGISIVDLDSTYYKEHYQCARRIIRTDVAVAVALPTVGSIAGSAGSDWRK